MDETDDTAIAGDSSARARSFATRFGGRKLQAYRGIPIFAAPGVHEAGLAALQAHAPAGARVLELGAGGGALSQRLHDAGFAVVACDLFADNFTPPDPIEFRAADLNAEFVAALGGPWDAIVALEPVEHLENPRHLLRGCRELLRPGGILVLSTPNLANPVSQASFLRQGDFQWFAEADYREQGHIAPVAPSVLRRCFDELGFAQVHEGSVANPFRRLRSLRKLGRRLVAHALSALSGTPRHLRGEVYLGAWRRAD
ncbi:methyltransferase domain-containing protein [Luteimonas sp. MC1572]|uniref:class I SAM-dependent methyltransferase n=1 Tax=Luteimonas sp. MC1572 TaxID=2799325 RepID=UPI0018F05D9F|nr:methyltransferase domain-containing protein [Luteimonas sp. MC1572]MBJ6981693.1 methyltransferase domain-containing protein [Luteimonas sp. MC1572]QQO02984.1 methyltransferase domain-containing protein [Luteimonas sp. MC1572]